MIPSFITSKPPTIPSSVAHDNAFTRVLKAGRLETDALTVGPNMTGTVVMGVAGVANRTLVLGTGAFTYTGIKSDDFVQVALKTVNASTAMGAGYSVAYVAAVGTIPAHMLVTAVTTAAPGTPVAGDLSTLSYVVFKTFV